MRVLALEREVEGAQWAGTEGLLREEAQRVWALYQAGVVREMYFDAVAHTAVLILECADLVEARTALDSLPLLQAGLIIFDVIELAPYTGFERLFEGG